MCRRIFCLSFTTCSVAECRHTVTLKPGESAWSDLAWNAPYVVKSVTPSYLEVTPPDETTHLTIGFAPGPMDDGSLHVTAAAAKPPVE